MTRRLRILRRCRSSSGQAIIETILTTWTLLMLFCILMQVFLIDQHAYRLATRAHARLFRNAYAGNQATTSYKSELTEKLEGGGEEYVPVIGYFRLYGLTREDLRIRSPFRDPIDPSKRIILGRGTAASITDGVAGMVDPSSYLAEISDGLQTIQDAKTKIEQARAALTQRGGRK
jgi:hypothetical protein